MEGTGETDSPLNFIRTRIARGTTVYADEGVAWNELHGRFTMHRINHQEAYSLDGDIYTNNAESFFSRMRRAEIGHHHHLADRAASWRATSWPCLSARTPS